MVPVAVLANDGAERGKASRRLHSSAGILGRGGPPPGWPALLPNQSGPPRVGSSHLPGPHPAADQTAGGLAGALREFPGAASGHSFASLSWALSTATPAAHGQRPPADRRWQGAEKKGAWPPDQIKLFYLPP